MTLLHEIEAAIPALRRYARAVLQDPVAADDLVQDCLERALATRRSWHGDGSVRVWMFRILLDLHHDALRPEQAVAVTEEATEPAQHTLQAAIARLPPDQRQALLLVALEGMTLAEAALVLGQSEGTLISRLGRARAALRAIPGRKGAAAQSAGMEHG